MASVNKAILIGNLGNAPEIRFLPNGDPVANFSIATSDIWKDKDGQKQERTEWHRVVAYRKLAEIAGEYLTKGSSVYIEGAIQSSKYTDKEGVERTVVQIRCDSLRMLGSKGGDGGKQESGAGRPVKQSAQSAKGDFDGFEDDIPF